MANKTLEQANLQLQDIINTQSGSIGQMQELFKTMNDQQAAQSSPDAFNQQQQVQGQQQQQAQQQPANGNVNMQQFATMVDQIVSKRIEPFAAGMVSMKDGHDRTVFERGGNVRMTDDQHNAIGQIRGKYAGMTYDEAVALLPANLALNVGSQSLQAVQPLSAEQLQIQAQQQLQSQQIPPQAPGDQPARETYRQPTAPAPVGATAPTGQSPHQSQQQKQLDNVYSMREVSEAMKKAGLAGNNQDRDAMGARMMAGIMLNEHGQPMFQDAAVRTG